MPFSACVGRDSGFMVVQTHVARDAFRPATAVSQYIMTSSKTGAVVVTKP